MEPNKQGTDGVGAGGSAAPDPSSPTGSGDATPATPQQPQATPEASVLGLLKGVSGRESKTLDEFTKHYQNLNANYGEVSNAIGAYRKQVQESLKVRGIDPAVIESGSPAPIAAGTETPNSGSDTELSKRLESIERTMARRDFLNEFPKAKDVLEVIEAVASSKGIPLRQAYIDSNLQRMAEQPNPNPGITPSGKVGIEGDTVNPLVQQLDEMRKRGASPIARRSEEEVRQRIVAEVSKQRQWPTYSN